MSVVVKKRKTRSDISMIVRKRIKLVKRLDCGQFSDTKLQTSEHMNKRTKPRSRKYEDIKKQKVVNNHVQSLKDPYLEIIEIDDIEKEEIVEIQSNVSNNKLKLLPMEEYIGQKTKEIISLTATTSICVCCNSSSTNSNLAWSVLTARCSASSFRSSSSEPRAAADAASAAAKEGRKGMNEGRNE